MVRKLFFDTATQKQPASERDKIIESFLKEKTIPRDKIRVYDQSKVKQSKVKQANVVDDEVVLISGEVK